MTARVVLIVLGEVGDPVVAAEKVLADPRATPLEAGVGWIIEAGDLDPRRARTRARQARYRAKLRDARDADPRDARDAADLENLTRFGEVSLSRSPMESESEREASENDANDARRDDAADATRRDADGWRRDATPATEAELELGRRKVRELGDELRARRKEAR
jgi:hypothetical protein